MVHSRQSSKFYGSQAVSIFNDVILAKSMGLTVEELRSAEKIGLLTTDNFIKMYGVNNDWHMPLCAVQV